MHQTLIKYKKNSLRKFKQITYKDLTHLSRRLPNYRLSKLYFNISNITRTKINKQNLLHIK